MCDCGALHKGSLDTQVESKEACDRTKDDFTSVYKKSYTRKSTTRPSNAEFQADYPDILAGPFTEYVVLNSKTNPGHPYEDVHYCYKRLVEIYPKMKRYLDNGPDPKVLVTDYKNRGRTVYQVDYCDLKDGFESKKSRDRERVSLPHDWGEVPVTTQRASYRVPQRLATWDLKPKAVHPPASVLQPNVKEREILQVTTGVSEYESRVGNLGDMIMQDQLNGIHQDGLECQTYEQMLHAQEN